MENQRTSSNEPLSSSGMYILCNLKFLEQAVAAGAIYASDPNPNGSGFHGINVTRSIRAAEAWKGGVIIELHRGKILSNFQVFSSNQAGSTDFIVGVIKKNLQKYVEVIDISRALDKRSEGSIIQNLKRKGYKAGIYVPR